jgi:hypothetical protein
VVTAGQQLRVVWSEKPLAVEVDEVVLCLSHPDLSFPGNAAEVSGHVRAREEGGHRTARGELQRGAMSVRVRKAVT